MWRRLEGPELEGYDVVGLELAVRVRVVRWPLLPPGAAGMTLGRLVLLADDDDRSGNRSLLAHELVHVRQFTEAGIVRFLWTYVSHYLRLLARTRHHRAAYLAIPAEQAARTETAAWLERRRATDSGIPESEGR